MENFPNLWLIGSTPLCRPIVCNHTRNKQIGLQLRGRPILLIKRMITDRIGLHSALVPLQIMLLPEHI